jgi:hypothetical protein
MAFLLALAFVAQDAPEPLWAAADIEFTRAIEDTVQGFAPATQPPAEWADIFYRMGSPNWRTRERASKEALAIVAADRGQTMWLMWGRRSRDLEIALRCNCVIRRANPCGSCKGLGFKHYDWGSDYECPECLGVGHLWPRSIWD